MATEYTVGEVKTLLAQFFDMAPEDIDEFVVIVKGECGDCGGRDAFQTIDTADRPEEFFDLLRGGVNCRGLWLA
jgi:hypothetical protein